MPTSIQPSGKAQGNHNRTVRYRSGDRAYEIMGASSEAKRNETKRNETHYRDQSIARRRRACSRGPQIAHTCVWGSGSGLAWVWGWGSADPVDPRSSASAIDDHDNCCQIRSSGS